jgi:hypothetical protein
MDVAFLDSRLLTTWLTVDSKTAMEMAHLSFRLFGRLFPRGFS